MKKQILLLLAALVCGVRTLLAVPAYPGRIVYTQPDGTKIVLERHGDEFGHWTTDAAGRTVRLHADGFSGKSPTRTRMMSAGRRLPAGCGPARLPSIGPMAILRWDRNISW